MSNNLTVAPRREFQSFHDLPIVLDLDTIDADIAILGIPYGAPYSMDDVTNDQTNAPTHIRRYCERALRGIDRWDFELGGPLLDGRLIKVVDVGDVPGNPNDIDEHYRIAEKVIETLLTKNVMPIVLGGDHGVPIPVLRGFKKWAPITLVHVCLLYTSPSPRD